MAERKKRGGASVYLYVAGRCLDDGEREAVKKTARKALARHGVRAQRDADAGLLPPLRGTEEACSERRHEITGAETVNIFTVGELAEPGKFILPEVEESMGKALGSWGLRFVILVSESPLHRHSCRGHDCIPSSVLARFEDAVLAESCLVDRETLGITLQDNEPKGLIFLLDRPEPGYVTVGAWESDPEVRAIPDGANGVGGRTLIRTFALERGGFQGGELPETMKAVTPEILGLVEEKRPDTLPMLVLANKVAVRSAIGGHDRSGLAVDLELENRTDGEITVNIPAGYLFEVIDPKAAVQNLATARGESIRIPPRGTARKTVSAYCANRRFAGPNGEAMRPTVFRMKQPGRSQGDVWQQMDGRGY